MHQKKSLVLILVKLTQNLAWVYIKMVIIVICLLMEKKYLNLKSTVNVLTTQFCLESVSNGFSTTESTEVSVNGDVYNFSVDYNSIDKSDIWNIYKYVITKNSIK